MPSNFITFKKKAMKAKSFTVGLAFINYLET